jgi:hypothetical protein
MDHCVRAALEDGTKAEEKVPSYRRQWSVSLSWIRK